MSIDFDKELNPAQREAALHSSGPVLVIAGAGSGKTRTIVYRLAHLAEQGIPPENILLLTFTRKASQEMLIRAGQILDRPLAGAGGGTFHSFAYSILRRNAQALGFDNGFTLMDRADSEGLIKEVKDNLALGKGDKSYPKKSTLTDLITKSRNKEVGLETILDREAFHLAPYLEDLTKISSEYEKIKMAHGLADYDDLLFHLDRLLATREDLRQELRRRFKYIMVDEFQDTNLVQARIVRHLAGEDGNIMAVGDDAQSIYGFRGANVENILKFPETFKNTKIIRLEQNYRSVQPILDLTNNILANALNKFDKKLFSDRKEGPMPRVVHSLSDRTQATLVVNRILELKKDYPLHEIAVLFRAGYHSYALEVALGQIGIDYKKYGGLRFHEAAHIKDALAYLRLALNPSDLVAWQRALGHIKGVGPKTTARIVNARLGGDDSVLGKMKKKYPALETLLLQLDTIKSCATPGAALAQAVTFYTPIMMERYPDDYPKREAGLEQLAQIATNYQNLDSFLADLCIDGDQEEAARREDTLVLSTAHSAKGLEWKAVIIIDLVEDRFPSKKSLAKPEDLEEERRLMYVACTRAKDSLTMFVPATIYNRYNGMSEPTMPSPFIRELPESCFESWHESYSGGTECRKPRESSEESIDSTRSDGTGKAKSEPEKLGFCRHRIFGKGKIIAAIPPDKYRVNFPGFGLKVIIGDYLEKL